MHLFYPNWQMRNSDSIYVYSHSHSHLHRRGNDKILEVDVEVRVFSRKNQRIYAAEFIFLLGYHRCRLKVKMVTMNLGKKDIFEVFPTENVWIGTWHTNSNYIYCWFNPKYDITCRRINRTLADLTNIALKCITPMKNAEETILRSFVCQKKIIEIVWLFSFQQKNENRGFFLGRKTFLCLVLS